MSKSGDDCPMVNMSMPMKIMTNSRQNKIIVISVIVFVLLAALVVFLDWNQIHQIIGKAHWQFRQRLFGFALPLSVMLRV